MTDITSKLFPNYTPILPSFSLDSLQKAADLHLKIVFKIHELTKIYQNLQSSLPSAHMHDREAM
jgi:hypothetical protein